MMMPIFNRDGFILTKKVHFTFCTFAWHRVIDMAYSTAKELREACRSGKFAGQTSGYVPAHAQANLCILPREYAFDFLLFCQRNGKPCPLLYVLEAGVHTLDDIDIRSDLPKYRVFRDGVFSEEVTDISHLWSNDFVTFVIGCSFSFEDALIRSGLNIRHIEQGRNVPMYVPDLLRMIG